MNARPVVFHCDAGACVGWFHAGLPPRRRAAVVLCRPLGYEVLCTYRTYTELAERLSAAGFDVLRFDYHGTGDSAGGDADPQRVQSWLASIHAAVDTARRLSGTNDVALFGVRFGATLAAHAAAERGGVRTLAMWAPCASGRAFAREMRAAELGRNLESGAPGMEALGMHYTPETLAAMGRLDAMKIAAAPARDVLVIGRDDMPGEGPLPRRLRDLGATVTYAAWPGYAGMMVVEPHEAVLASDTIDSIVQWLGARHPRMASDTARLPTLPWPGSFTSGPVVERPVAFGADGGLFGMLAEPSAKPTHTDTAVLMLNVGGNYRIGPNRNYVKAARELAVAGYRTLRFDVSGIGDSRTEAGFSGDSMYRDRATVDVSAAIDMLAARGCTRFFLMGICSGSYLAFQTALKDARVNGIMLTNSRLLEWDAEKSGPWQSRMQSYYKSTRYYKQALLRSEVYARLLRGDVNVRGIAGRMLDLMRARIVRAWDRWVRHAPPREGVLAKFRHLSHRGVETLVVMSEHDDALDYVEFHLGPGGRRMRNHRNFRFVLVPNADHTFSTVQSQQALVGVLRDHLAHLHEKRDRSWSGNTNQAARGETAPIA